MFLKRSLGIYLSFFDKEFDQNFGVDHMSTVCIGKGKDLNQVLA